MRELKILPFVNKTTDNGDFVVQRLDEALNAAKNGGVSNCVIVMVMSDGGVMDCWANREKPFAIVGAIESIKREFMDACIDGRK